MYPEVEEYFKIATEAKEVYETTRRAEQAEYDVAYEAVRNNSAAREQLRVTFNARQSTLQSVYTATEGLAWARLGLSDDKVVAFIARNCGGYRNDSEPYALVILKMLPASVTDIRKAAREGNWCNVFDQFLNQAIAAGVIADNRSREYRNLEQWVSGNWGQRYVIEVFRQVDAVIAAEAERYVAEKNGAPAPQDVVKQSAAAADSDVEKAAVSQIYEAEDD